MDMFTIGKIFTAAAAATTVTTPLTSDAVIPDLDLFENNTLQSIVHAAKANLRKERK